nr:AAA-ATPase ASD, mitochondrial-like [Malus domestica]
MIGGMWPQMGSVIASMVFVITIFQRYLPLQLRDHVEGYTQKLVGFVYPYIQITFDEFTDDFRNQSEIYSAIQSYLSTKSSTLEFLSDFNWSSVGRWGCRAYLRILGWKMMDFELGLFLELEEEVIIFNSRRFGPDLEP